MPTYGELLLYAPLALAVLIILALAGATVSVRHGTTHGKISVRSIIRALLGHRERDRNHEDHDP